MKIQVKATEQYFLVMLLIMLYKNFEIGVADGPVREREERVMTLRLAGGKAQSLLV